MAGPESEATTGPLRRLMNLLSTDKADIGAVVIFSVLNGLLLLATPVAVQALVNNVAFGATAPSIAILASLLFIALIMAAAVLGVQTWIVEILQRRIFVRLVADLSERLRRIAWRVRDTHYNPELVNRFFDTVTIQKASAKLLLGGIGNVLSILVGLIVIAFYHPLLLAMGGAIFAIVLVIFIAPLGAGTRSAIRESAAKYAVAGWLEEITRHPLTFRTNGSEAYVRERSRELAKEYVDARRAHFRVVFGQVISALIMQVLAATAVLGLGGWLVVQGELTLGQLVAAELIVTVVVSGVAKLGKHAETYYDLLAAVDKVGKLTDLEVEEDFESLAQPQGQKPASLSVHDVRVGRGERLSFVQEPGEVLGVTGPHGAGKSHLLEILYGLRRPQDGHISYDAMNLRDVPAREFRRDVAMVSEAGLIEASILDNMVLGRDIDVHVVHEALDAVGLREDISSLPEGLSTRLNPMGAPLSPGQAVRVAIARAILSQPRLLLIDGVLDELSVPSRRRVMKSLTAMNSTCSAIVVTGEEDVLSQCDRTIELGLHMESI